MREVCDWKAVLFVEDRAIFLVPTRAAWLAHVGGIVTGANIWPRHLS